MKISRKHILYIFVDVTALTPIYLTETASFIGEKFDIKHFTTEKLLMLLLALILIAFLSILWISVRIKSIPVVNKFLVDLSAEVSGESKSYRRKSQFVAGMVGVLLAMRFLIWVC